MQNALTHATARTVPLVILSQEEVDIACALFKDWFLLRENIYDGVRLKLFDQRFKKTDSLKIIESIDPDSINEHYQIGKESLGHYISSIQTGIKKVGEVLDSNETKEAIAAFININNLLSEMQYPIVHSEVCSFLAYISTNLDIQALTVPDWQECNQLKTRIYKHTKEYVTNEGKVNLKNSLETHRFLLKLGKLENDPIYNAMLAINESIGSARQIFELQYAKLKQRAIQNGLNGYFEHWKNYINIGQDQIDLAQLEEMAMAIKGLINDRHRLSNLEAALPYINHSLFDNAVLTAKKLELLLEYDLPEWFIDNIKLIIRSCTNYASVIKELSDNNLDLSAKFSVSKLALNYHKLSDNGLEAMIQSSTEEWYSYIKRRNQIIDIIQTDLKLEHCLGNDISNKDHLDPAPLLAEQLIALIDDTMFSPINISNNLQTSLNEKSSQYLPLIELLLQNRPPEVELSTELLSTLNIFLNDFKGFENTLRARIYLKQDQ